MASPYSTVANGLLYLDRPTGRTAVDWRGNPIAEVVSEVVVVLLEHAATGYRDSDPGRSTVQSRLSAIAVEPSLLPEYVRHGAIARIEKSESGRLGGLQTTNGVVGVIAPAIAGTCRVLSRPLDPWGVSAIEGQRFDIELLET